MKLITVLCFLVLMVSPAISGADTGNMNVDVQQNSGSNNVSYDLPSKFYAGLDGGLSVYSNINETHPALGAFFGYKFNDYFGLELNFLYPGAIGKSAGVNLPPLYTGDFYIISADVVASYPIIPRNNYTVSLFAIGGYGACTSNYQYSVSNGTVRNSITEGAFNAGLGVNLDLRANVSFRAAYIYQQVRYPNPVFNSNSWGDNLFQFGVYYNF